MNEILGYKVDEINYSKVISKCNSGEIVKKDNNQFLIINQINFNEREEKIFEKLFNEIKQTKIKISKKSDIYFFVKEYCIENMLLLNKEEREKILYLLEQEVIEYSILTKLLNDQTFEEIVINGENKHLLVYHHVFGWLKTNIYFLTNEKIKTILNKMAAKQGKQLSYNCPILNTVLDDGSRLNASMNPIAFSGINATIRKFKEIPLSPIDIVNSEAINKKAMSFLWMAMQTPISIMVCGNTGSGKTTTLNSLFCFLPKSERIIVVEETPEIVLPQDHKIKLNTAEQIGIGLEKLIENTFRMRPDRVIVGEIRTSQEAKAFVNTMLAGQAKGSYATFHAESANEAIERMNSFDIKKSYLKSIDLIIVQKRIQKINFKNNQRKEIRKVTQICEILQGQNFNELELNPIFEIDNTNYNLVKKNESIRVKNKICETFSIDEKEYQKLLKEKEKIFDKINNINFYEFFEFVERER
ncbi:MAG: type II/IV secretion system ATPase subunit [Candidatus ainarchaeum sp.]|nr:type II/IV secretion system ATPase subunit [Candidatus ainarchaeum sp.]